MKKIIHMIILFLGLNLSHLASAHDYSEFSHSIPPQIQTQIIDVLDDLLLKIPYSEADVEKFNELEYEHETFDEQLFARLDLGNSRSLRILQELLDESPLAQVFAPLGVTMYLEELMMLLEEYTLHVQQPGDSSLSENLFLRLAKIEHSLKQGEN